STEAKPMPQATARALIFGSRASRSAAVRRLESSRPATPRRLERITAAADTGPAHGPRPASSTPHTGAGQSRSSRRCGRFGSAMGVRAPQRLHLVMTETAGNVVVDHADG